VQRLLCLMADHHPRDDLASGGASRLTGPACAARWRRWSARTWCAQVCGSLWVARPRLRLRRESSWRRHLTDPTTWGDRPSSPLLRWRRETWGRRDEIGRCRGTCVVGGGTVSWALL